MKEVYLYIRVSTDEQAERGYSQRDQEERLRKYCQRYNLIVKKVIYEDYSAKTFKRPGWSKIMIDLRKYKGQCDLILFVKWDRFSRNTAEAYQMIGTLRKLGVEPQAIEQPLDLSVPEHKFMLAYYLTSPEVDNDRRSINVFYGMRRARKEGRWMGMAPIGYINRITEDGRKYIAPKKGEAEIMVWVFNELAQGRYCIEQVRKMANKKGLKCERNNFWMIIRNPVYCGKIFVPKHKDEEAMFVQGQHEPLISEALFYAVQDVLEGRKKKMKTRVVFDENIPLRGFLVCPKCGKMLTGSASRGRSAYYYYYHCTSTCGFRHKAPDANAKIVEKIREFALPIPKLQLFKEVINNIYKDKTRMKRVATQQLKTQLEEANKRLSKARELLLIGDIEADDYRIIKAESESRITRLEAELVASSQNVSIAPALWDQAIENISQLDVLYEKGSVEQKRKIIGSMFPEKLVFDGFNYRTARVNDALGLIRLINNELRNKKDGKNHAFADLSHQVTHRGIEPLFQP